MVRYFAILAVAWLGLSGTLAQACQFDLPGQSHEQWLAWVASRNQKNAQQASGQAQNKVAREEKKAAAPDSPRAYRYPRTINSGNPVIRIGR